MLSDTDQRVGGARLVGGRLSSGDASDLLAAFRRWLGSRAVDYRDMGDRLASASGDIAEKLAGALALLKKQGFSTTKLKGGALGIESSKADRWTAIVEYAFGLLYDLPGQGPIDNVVAPNSTATRTRVRLLPCQLPRQRRI